MRHLYLLTRERDFSPARSQGSGTEGFVGPSPGGPRCKDGSQVVPQRREVRVTRGETSDSVTASGPSEEAGSSGGASGGWPE
jgi:hypothetical protein